MLKGKPPAEVRFFPVNRDMSLFNSVKASAVCGGFIFEY